MLRKLLITAVASIALLGTATTVFAGTTETQLNTSLIFVTPQSFFNTTGYRIDALNSDSEVWGTSTYLPFYLHQNKNDLQNLRIEMIRSKTSKTSEEPPVLCTFGKKLSSPMSYVPAMTIGVTYKTGFKNSIKSCKVYLISPQSSS